MDVSKIITSLGAEKTRFLKFCAVGGSGVAVNLLFVWVGNACLFAPLGEGLKTSLAYVFGIAVSILTNFILNDLWTWSDREKKGAGHFFVRLLKYYLVSAVAGVAQFLCATGVVWLFRIWLYAAFEAVPLWAKLAGALVGIAVGTLINFVMNHFWTFRK